MLALPLGVSSPQPSAQNTMHESLSTGRLVDLAAVGTPSGNSTPAATAAPAVSSSSALSVAERDRIADDILNKYREMRPLPPPLPLLAPNATSNGLRPELTATAGASATTAAIAKTEEPLIPYYDPANITQCRAFIDAKRKLRLVLSSAANIPTNAAATSRPATAGDLERVTGSGGGAAALLADERADGRLPRDDARTNLTEFLKLLVC